MTKKPIDLLQQYWKHTSFREPQEAIIDAVLQRKDTFALLPTGGGKSICFQIPALLLPGTCLVISPLVALMQDQVNNLNALGIKAAAIVGGTSLTDIDAILDNCLYGEYKLLYLSPERLEQTWLLERIENLKISLIAVDEAHCISQWGNDFRPAYLKINQLRKLFSSVGIIALTGSANKRVIADICTNLELKDVALFTKSFYRDNLIYGVYQVENKEAIVERILQKNPFPTIIYVRSRKETQLLAQQLNQKNYKANFFHGGLNTFEKKKRLDDWMAEKTPIMVATNAFGMGIDKKNVRNVIHLQLPENLENYYQEAGRAGRDESKAFASLLLSPSEPKTVEDWCKENIFDKAFLKLVYRKLNNYLSIGLGEGYNTSYSFSFNQFCLHYKFPYTLTYNALQFLDRQAICRLTPNSNNKTQVQFVVSSSELLDYVYDNERQENVLLQIIRHYPGIHEYNTPINLAFISEQVHEPILFIQECLQTWHQENLCIFTPEEHDLELTFYEAWEEDKTIYRTFPFLEQQNKLKREQYEAIYFYAQNDDICKNKILLQYFDEKLEQNCGTCSTCLQRSKKKTTVSLTQIKELVLLHLQREEVASASELEIALNLSIQDILVVLQILVEQQQIKLNNKNQYSLI
ncbi:ATP-dependent DNA helicase RecQ [Myroides sp. WP-1]|uniref:RecQ family ATP-dependent DNA helicase n=1 Tax=Myroides sp. WP-1 TaxID=2759944 RepID=UPI0015FB8585|nr:RecQ family ATP-dependent DNA helicase [Myroides sp. WP-1]MBB1139694.1 RecQ family ATP-dependent DNA helicase [Myroides sp. WP-1]